MEYTINHNEEFIIAMFEYDGRNWEIAFERESEEPYIQYLILKRIDELIKEYGENGSYENSALYADYTKKEQINGN